MGLQKIVRQKIKREKLPRCAHTFREIILVGVFLAIKVGGIFWSTVRAVCGNLILTNDRRSTLFVVYFLLFLWNKIVTLLWNVLVNNEHVASSWWSLWIFVVYTSILFDEQVRCMVNVVGSVEWQLLIFLIVTRWMQFDSFYLIIRVKIFSIIYKYGCIRHMYLIGYFPPSLSLVAGLFSSACLLSDQSYVWSAWRFGRKDLNVLSFISLSAFHNWNNYPFFLLSYSSCTACSISITEQ